MKIFLLLPFFFLLTGCAQYKIPNEKFLVQSRHNLSSPPEILRYENEKKASKHWLYKLIPRHRTQIQWYDFPHWLTWMLFGNDDDGLFGESFINPYKPYDKNNSIKAINWWLRNPLHNFCFYAIGSAGRENGELILLYLDRQGFHKPQYSPKAGRNFGGEDSSLFLALHGGKPFISLRLSYPWNHKTEFYIGWRERGNFGMKFLPMVNEDKHTQCFLRVESKDINDNQGVINE